MSLFRNFAIGLRSLFRKKQVDRELDEELGAYLEMEAAEKMRQGISRKDALREVRLERGSLEVTKELVRSGGWEFFVERCWQDLHYSVRVLRKSPGFAAVAIVTLALGIGANTAIFSLTDQILLRDLPVPHPEQLFILRSPGPNHGHTWGDVDQGAQSFSYPMYKDLRERATVFSGLLACRRITVNVSGHGETQAAHADLISGNFFQTLEVQPVLGRLFASIQRRDRSRREYGRGSELLLLVAAIRRRPIYFEPAAYGERRPADRCRRGSQRILRRANRPNAGPFHTRHHEGANGAEPESNA